MLAELASPRPPMGRSQRPPPRFDISPLAPGRFGAATEEALVSRGSGNTRTITTRRRVSRVNRGSLSAFLRSFRYAGQGVWHAVRTERNMRVHLCVAAAAIIAGLVLGIGAVAWACVALAIGLVLVTETLNTVVEALADLVAPELHPLAKIAKDAAAGAVLIASVTAIAVGIAVFLPRLLG
jgi:undecaprenol kinase